jgi:hypothetical protein
MTGVGSQRHNNNNYCFTARAEQVLKPLYQAECCDGRVIGVNTHIEVLTKESPRM